MVGPKEAKGAPLTTSPAQLIDGAINLVVAASFEALATPPVGFASTGPKAVFRPMVSGRTSPAVTILLWAVKGKVEV